MRILIVEDEKAAARRLAKLVLELHPAADIQGPIDSISETLQWLSLHPTPDLLLLDIHLADGSSFELFEQMQIDFPVIFITAYDEYAIRAFRVNAIDYLLKPVKKGELETALKKFSSNKSKGGINYTEIAKALHDSNQDRRYLVKMGRQIKMIETKDIAYIYTQDKITFLVTSQGKRYPIDYSLERMEEMLPSKSYYRINRQYIIGIHAIKEMITYSKARVKIILFNQLTQEKNLIVSTERSPHFKKWLKGEE